MVLSDTSDDRARNLAYSPWPSEQKPIGVHCELPPSNSLLGDGSASACVGAIPHKSEDVGFMARSLKSETLQGLFPTVAQIWPSDLALSLGLRKDAWKGPGLLILILMANRRDDHAVS